MRLRNRRSTVTDPRRDPVDIVNRVPARANGVPEIPEEIGRSGRRCSISQSRGRIRRPAKRSRARTPFPKASAR
jgi:hypothetical protein